MIVITIIVTMSKFQHLSCLLSTFNVIFSAFCLLYKRVSFSLSLSCRVQLGTSHLVHAIAASFPGNNRPILFIASFSLYLLCVCLYFPQHFVCLLVFTCCRNNFRSYLHLINYCAALRSDLTVPSVKNVS
jgi:hypothetical protein